MPTKHGVARSNRAGRANIKKPHPLDGAFFVGSRETGNVAPSSLTGIDAWHQSQYLKDVVILRTS